MTTKKIKAWAVVVDEEDMIFDGVAVERFTSEYYALSVFEKKSEAKRFSNEESYGSKVVPVTILLPTKKKSKNQ